MALYVGKENGLGGVAAYFLIEDASEFILVGYHASKMGVQARRV
jgi:hypothetical protein